MRYLMTALLATALCGTLSAEDKEKTKVKVDGRDPVTGEKVKVRSKTKAESDGDYKEKTDVRVGDTKEKRRVKVDDDGDSKTTVKKKGPDGKYESKTKVDR
jgi:hypothetical protein